MSARRDPPNCSWSATARRPTRWRGRPSSLSRGRGRVWGGGELLGLGGGGGPPPLSEAGRHQAEQVGFRLAQEPFDALYVSTLQRTAQTAAPLVARSGMTPVVDADLREVFLGAWEGGLLRLKAADGDPLFLRVMTEQRWDVIPGAESRAVFGGRLRRAVERIVGAHPGGRVVVF